MKAQIIVHGGAWNETDQVEIDRHQKACDQAAKLGAEMLQQGAVALDVVEKVVQFLEDVPFLDAGIGSHLQLDGNARLDASIMTSDLRFGAVLQLEKTQHPISLARKILDYGYHGVITQPGVNNLAREEGMPACDLVTEAELNYYLSFRKESHEEGDRLMSYKHLVEKYREAFKKRLGTVGCVVRDNSGAIAVGTSTGGLPLAYPGRVGDTGMPGGGTYANQFGGTSCTGDGEKIMLICLGKTTVDLMESGLVAEEAAKRAIEKLSVIGGEGGVICIDAKGGIGQAKSTSYLASSNLSI